METKRDITIKTWDGTWTYHPKVSRRREPSRTSSRS